MFSDSSLLGCLIDIFRRTRECRIIQLSQGQWNAFGFESSLQKTGTFTDRSFHNDVRSHRNRRNAEILRVFFIMFDPLDCAVV